MHEALLSLLKQPARIIRKVSHASNHATTQVSPTTPDGSQSIFATFWKQLKLFPSLSSSSCHELFKVPFCPDDTQLARKVHLTLHLESTRSPRRCWNPKDSEAPPELYSHCVGTTARTCLAETLSVPKTNAARGAIGTIPINFRSERHPADN